MNNPTWKTFQDFGYYPSQLSKFSDKKIYVECPSCERLIIKSYRFAKKFLLCRTCYLLAIKKNNNCLTCGKIISIKSLYCSNCFQLGKLNHNYKDGRTNKIYYCIKCKKRISYLSKHQMCKKCIGKYITAKRNQNRIVSKTEKRKHSKAMKGLLIGRKNPMFGKQTHGKFGYYKNIFMRSSYELNFAKWCDLSGIKWKYESKAFDLGNTTYTPDFYLPEFDCYIEIKGYWHPKNKKKFIIFLKKFSNINIQIFDFKRLNNLGIIN